MKAFSRTFLILFLGMFFLPIFSIFAVEAVAPIEYKLLAPLPAVTTVVGGDTSTPESYIKGIVVLAVAVSGALAVLMLIAAGIEYMTKESFTGKSEAKDKIQNALVGLLLVIASFTILNTIDEKFLNINLYIKSLPPGAAFDTDLGEGTRPNDPRAPDNPNTEVPSGAGAAWENDSRERTTIENMGLTINSDNCTVVGQRGCTSVYMIGSGVISGLEELYKGCLSKGVNCPVVVTGGTEYWLHGNESKVLSLLKGTEHYPEGNVVDIRPGDTVSKYIRETGKKTTESGCSTLGDKYKLGNGTYVFEKAGASAANTADHWHICYTGGSTQTTNQYNPPCNNCITLDSSIDVLKAGEDGACKAPGPCMAEKGLADELKGLSIIVKSRSAISILISQLYPPSTLNVRGCIKNGTCVVATVAPTSPKSMSQVQATQVLLNYIKEGRKLNASLLVNEQNKKMYTDAEIPVVLDASVQGAGVILIWKK